MYTRELDGERILVVCNFDTQQKIALPEKVKEILLSNYGRCVCNDGDFRPYEIAVYSL
jgi:hypothetical protein